MSSVGLRAALCAAEIEVLLTQETSGEEHARALRQMKEAQAALDAHYPAWRAEAEGEARRLETEARDAYDAHCALIRRAEAEGEARRLETEARDAYDAHCALRRAEKETERLEEAKEKERQQRDYDSYKAWLEQNP